MLIRVSVAYTPRDSNSANLIAWDKDVNIEGYGPVGLPIARFVAF